ncbi:MAG: imidazole glycerol phosphate synthase subunit HisF, partial [Pseudomonadales bacterium]
MLNKRVIACLDVRDGKLAKSVKFVDTKDIGDPVATARAYYEDGLDELVFYDITASSDARDIMLDVVEAVAQQVYIPFSVGGGIRTVADATRLLWAGAEKINVNSAAVQRPELISECAHAIGAQNTVLSMDILRVKESPAQPSGYEII